MPLPDPPVIVIPRACPWDPYARRPQWANADTGSMDPRHKGEDDGQEGARERTLRHRPAGARSPRRSMSGGMRRRDLLIRLGLIAGGVGGAWWLRDHVLWKRADGRLSRPNGASELAGSMPSRARQHPHGRGLGEWAACAGADRFRARSIRSSTVRWSRRLGLTHVFDIPMVAYGVGGQAQVGRGDDAGRRDRRPAGGAAGGFARRHPGAGAAGQRSRGWTRR